jgi:hypothetical protein
MKTITETITVKRFLGETLDPPVDLTITYDEPQSLDEIPTADRFTDKKLLSLYQAAYKNAASQKAKNDHFADALKAKREADKEYANSPEGQKAAFIAAAMAPDANGTPRLTREQAEAMAAQIFG